MHNHETFATEATKATVDSSIDPVADELIRNATAPRVNTDLMVHASLERLHPGKYITTVPSTAGNVWEFAASGTIKIVPSKSNGTTSGPLVRKQYVPASHRWDKGDGELNERILFGRYELLWEGFPEPFDLYVVEGRDGVMQHPFQNNYFISSSKDAANDLIIAIGKYSQELHDQIWVFDQGRWYKDASLRKAINKASWDAVILDPSMKEGINNDINRFFDGQETYKRLGVPWKRGLILHGPPGNGKTISLKAAMNMLSKREFEVQTLYVKTLKSNCGPEQSLNQIFAKARIMAPCLLVFEDLDSLVSDKVRSFFLNQVDGLADNDGILMVGSTNHLERLDPGISKRPSRFDRKYLFSNPKLEQRVMYAQFWREKLSTNPETSEKKADDLIPQVDFPEELCKEVAKITEDFSFAYMQEAFVSTLLQLAHGNLDEGSPTSSADETKAGNSEVEVNPGLEGLVLWKEFQKQVDILKEQMASVDNESGSRTSIPPPDADAGQPLSGVYPNGMRWQQAQPIAAHRQLR